MKDEHIDNLKYIACKIRDAFAKFGYSEETSNFKPRVLIALFGTLSYILFTKLPLRFFTCDFSLSFAYSKKAGSLQFVYLEICSFIS